MAAFDEQPYLSKFLTMPDRMSDTFEHVWREAEASRSSRYSCEQHQRLLLSGSAIPPVLARFGPAFPDYLDAERVERTVDGIKAHLNRMLSPDAAGGVSNDFNAATIVHQDRIDPKLALGDIDLIRDVMEVFLDLDEMEELAEGLAELHEIDPELTTKILELRLHEAETAFDDAIRRSRDCEVRSLLKAYRELIFSVRKIAIAYALRQFFMMAASRIHAPTGWSVLDELQRGFSGGTLRVRTIVKRLELELKRVNKAVGIYKRNRVRCLISKSGRRTLKQANNGIPAMLKRLDIEARARVQMVLWKTQHGQDFDDLLDDTILEIRYNLIRFRRLMKAFKKAHHPNKVLGNLNGPSVQVQAYLAVLEAVRWTMMLDGEDGSPTAETLLSVAVRNQGHKLEELMDKYAEKRSKVNPKADRLFLAMRSAFIQDDDALPSSLWVLDNTTNPHRLIRTHDGAARVNERYYTLAELLQAHNQPWRKADKGADDDEEGPRIGLDFDIKRQASQWLKQEAGNDQSPLYLGRDMVRRRVIGDIKGV